MKTFMYFVPCTRAWEHIKIGFWAHKFSKRKINNIRRFNIIVQTTTIQGQTGKQQKKTEVTMAVREPKTEIFILFFNSNNLTGIENINDTSDKYVLNAHWIRQNILYSLLLLHLLAISQKQKRKKRKPKTQNIISNQISKSWKLCENRLNSTRHCWSLL